MGAWSDVHSYLILHSLRGFSWVYVLIYTMFAIRLYTYLYYFLHICIVCIIWHVLSWIKTNYSTDTGSRDRFGPGPVVHFKVVKILPAGYQTYLVNAEDITLFQVLYIDDTSSHQILCKSGPVKKNLKTHQLLHINKIVCINVTHKVPDRFGTKVNTC